MNLELPVAQWERVERQVVWAYRGDVSERFREWNYDPVHGLAAWFLISGEVEIQSIFGLRIVRKGHWILLGNHRVHRRYSRGAKILSVRFRVRWPNGTNLFDQQEPLVLPGNEATALTEVGFALADEAGAAAGEERCYFAALPVSSSRYLRLRNLFEGWFQGYLQCLARNDYSPTGLRTIDSRTSRITEVLEEALRSGTVVGERAMAVKAGLSLSQFKRLFAQCYGLSLKKWWDQRRIEIACDRLLTGQFSVKQVAFSLGFRTPNHFSSWFRKRTGHPPRRFNAQDGLE